MSARSRTHWDTKAMRQAIEAHDQEAFNRAFNPFAASIKEGLCRYLYKTFAPLSWEECQDFTQEAIVNTWVKAFGGKVQDLSKLKSYCYSTARQQVIKYLDRTKGRHHEEIDESALPSALWDSKWHPRYHQEEHWREVDRCWAFLKKLDEKCRKLLLLSSQGAPMAYIAEAMDYSSTESAKSSKYRCRQKLIQQLREEKEKEKEKKA
jgi:RNA polymerase sigma factor (sigma-70 family)